MGEKGTTHGRGRLNWSLTKNAFKSMEPDGMHLRVLMELADSFRRPLSSWKGSVHWGKSLRSAERPMFKNRQERRSEEQQAGQPKKITSKIFEETKHLRDKKMVGNTLDRLTKSK